MGTILTTIRWLSIFTGALSLFYLGNAWFEFGLGEVFTRIYAWYAGILHPVVELLKPVALWLVGLFGWSLPVWWRDVPVLYLSLGGATARGSDTVLAILEREDGSEPAQARVLKIPGYRYGVLWLPVRILAWPLVWLWAARQASGFRAMWWQHISKGYLGSSVWEFGKIIAGALLFAALNAGLG